MILNNLETNRRYGIIYADPPWAYLWGKGGNFAPEKHYKTMKTVEICNLPIRGLADKNCALFLWTTMPCLLDAIQVIKAWGFRYKTCAFSWIKIRKDGKPLAGMGSYTKSNCELCLLAMRGHLKSVDKTVRQIIMEPRRGHSVKPPMIREEIVRLFGDLPRIELFARQQVDGWDCWGDEAGKKIDHE